MGGAARRKEEDEALASRPSTSFLPMEAIFEGGETVLEFHGSSTTWWISHEGCQG